MRQWGRQGCSAFSLQPSTFGLFMITVRLFGMTKSLAKNLSELSLELNGARQVKDLVALLTAQYPQIGALIQQKKVLVSVNHDIAHEEMEIKDGDEVALLPPFAGGAPA